MRDYDGPIGARRRLGLELRNLRIDSGKRNLDAAEAAETSRTRISRLEQGTLRKFKDAEIRALLELYRVSDPKVIRRFLELAHRARQQIWLDDYADVIPDRFEPYVGLEAEAIHIRSYTDHLVTGLLQTEDYARAAIAAVRVNDPPETIRRLVELRMRRQQVLRRGGPPGLWVIMDEMVVRRAVGGPEVMSDQLAHLLETARRPHVTMQVLPHTLGTHAGLDGPFTVLEFRDQETPMAYVNSAAGNHYPRNAATFRERFDLLRTAAMSMDRTLELIATVRKELAAEAPAC